MRIISGSLKGRALATPPQGSKGIRPTSDMAREALFSILGRWPQGSFLDLFTGTGAVGVEPWSRGYAPVTAVERDEAAWKLLTQNVRGTDIQTLRKDVLRLPETSFSNLAVAFCDPPYAQGGVLWSQLSSRLHTWLNPTGILVWECDRHDDFLVDGPWERVDVRRYGLAHLHFLEPR